MCVRERERERETYGQKGREREREKADILHLSLEGEAIKNAEVAVVYRVCASFIRLHLKCSTEENPI